MLHQPAAAKRCGLTQVLDSMFKFFASLIAITFTLPVSASERWTFHETVSGKQTRVLTLSLTQEPAKTCISGDWKKIRVISDPSHYTNSPAYTVRGNSVEILLKGDMCDSYNSYVFDHGLTEAGEHVAYGMSSSKSLGTVKAIKSK